MPYIELCELTNNSSEITYSTPQQLQQLLAYAYRMDKTYEDSFRKRNFGYNGPYCGCEPFPFPREFEKDFEEVYQLMMLTVIAFPPNKPISLARHRIISFSATEYLLPQDLDALGRNIALFYSQNNHTAAYCVHADKENVHIHLVVNNISYTDGNLLNISFEYGKLLAICKQFKDKMDGKLLGNYKNIEKRERILYGKPTYTAKVGLSAAEQIRINSDL